MVADLVPAAQAERVPASGTGRATGLAYATVVRVDWRRGVLEGTRGDADMVLRDGRVCLFVDRDA